MGGSWHCFTHITLSYGSKHCLRMYKPLVIIPQSYFLRRYLDPWGLSYWCSQRTKPPLSSRIIQGLTDIHRWSSHHTPSTLRAAVPMVDISRSSICWGPRRRTLAENGGLKQQKHGGFHSVLWVSSTNGDLCDLMKNSYIPSSCSRWLWKSIILMGKWSTNMQFSNAVLIRLPESSQKLPDMKI